MGEESQRSLTRLPGPTLRGPKAETSPGKATMSATSATLTLEQEKELGYRIQKGDESAINSLVEANLRFAMYMANRYRRETVDIDDLIQEANIGLMLEARYLRLEKGVRFTSYAGWWIEAQLRRFLSRHTSVMRVGESTQQIARRLRRIEERLLQENEKVTIEMVAAEAGIEVPQAEFALGSLSSTPLSLDRTMGDVDGEFTLQDMVADETTEDAFEQAEVETILAPILEHLDARQRLRILRCATVSTAPATTSARNLASRGRASSRSKSKPSGHFGGV